MLGGGEIGMGTRAQDRGGDGGAERAGLAGTGDAHRAAGDIGVNLHEERVFLRDAAAADDAADGHAVFRRCAR